MPEASPAKFKLVISDFHLSRGKWLRDGRKNPLEDFHQDEKFKEFLEHYSTGEFREADVELVVNGDFFDPLAVIPIPDGLVAKGFEFPIEVEEPAAIQKFELITQGHPIAMEALRSFLGRGKKIIFRWGNHDAGLLWPGVQEFLAKSLAPPKPTQLEFQQAPYIFDRVCIDHGHQYEVIHQFDERRIFIDRETPQGRIKIQNLPFGSFFVLGFLNRIKIKRSYINQVYPMRAYLRLSILLEPVNFLVTSLKLAWFFIKMRLVTHPMRFARISKTVEILGELLNRPHLEDIASQILSAPSEVGLPFDTIIMGHNHQAAHRIFPGSKQYINTGTWTPITSLDFGSLGHRVLRTYALVEYVEGKARVSLKVWNGKQHVSEDYT